MNTEKYLVSEKKKLNLYDVPTSYNGKLQKEEVKEVLIPENIAKMREYHERLYAENNQSLLIVLQAMDAAGKDSLIKNIMTGVNPQGTKVVSLIIFGELPRNFLHEAKLEFLTEVTTKMSLCQEFTI